MLTLFNVVLAAYRLEQDWSWPTDSCPDWQDGHVPDLSDIDILAERRVISLQRVRFAATPVNAGLTCRTVDLEKYMRVFANGWHFLLSDRQIPRQ